VTRQKEIHSTTNVPLSRRAADNPTTPPWLCTGHTHAPRWRHKRKHGKHIADGQFIGSVLPCSSSTHQFMGNRVLKRRRAQHVVLAQNHLHKTNVEKSIHTLAYTKGGGIRTYLRLVISFVRLRRTKSTSDIAVTLTTGKKVLGNSATSAFNALNQL
jgi:hypothetical protein